MSSLEQTIGSYLADAGVEWEPGARDGEFVVTLPGEKKLRTVASLVAGERELSVSAFVIRNPDEDHERFYRYLLRRNLRLPGLAYSVDDSGGHWGAPLIGIQPACLYSGVPGATALGCPVETRCSMSAVLPWTRRQSPTPSTSSHRMSWVPA